MTKLGWGVSAVAVVLVAAAVVLLWPASDPLAHVQTVAVQMSGSSNTTPTDSSQKPPLVRGLEVALGDHHIRIVTDPEAADAVIDIEFDAADILGNLGASADGSISALTQALNDPSPRVKESAAEALQKIRGSQ